MRSPFSILSILLPVLLPVSLGMGCSAEQISGDSASAPAEPMTAAAPSGTTASRDERATEVPRTEPEDRGAVVDPAVTPEPDKAAEHVTRHEPRSSAGHPTPPEADSSRDHEAPPETDSSAGPVAETVTDEPRSSPPEAAPRAAPASPSVLSIGTARGGPPADVPLEIADPSSSETLSRMVEVDGTSFSVTRYEPSLRITDRLEPAPGGDDGFPALRLTFDSSYGDPEEHWLVPGSRLLGRASLSGPNRIPWATVECFSPMPPGELEDLDHLLWSLQRPGPSVLVEVKESGKKVIVPARPGARLRLAEKGWSLEVVRAFQSFALEGGRAVDASEQPTNPAVEARVTEGGKERTAWLFSRYPDFSRGAEDASASLRLVFPLGHPPRAEIALVDGGKGRPARVFVGMAGELFRDELPLSGTASLGGVKITFHERIENARVAQDVQATPRGRPAVLLGWEDRERWVGLGIPEEFPAGEKVFYARLRRPAATGPHEKFHAAPEPRRSLPRGHPPLPKQKRQPQRSRRGTQRTQGKRKRKRKRKRGRGREEEEERKRDETQRTRRTQRRRGNRGGKSEGSGREQEKAGRWSRSERPFER